jgi:outer membrane protein assembly factor BamB
MPEITSRLSTALADRYKIERELAAVRLDDQASPAIAEDGTIHVGSWGSPLSTMYAINPDGSEKLTFPAVDGSVFSSAAVGADSTIYVAGGGPMPESNPEHRHRFAETLYLA